MRLHAQVFVVPAILMAALVLPVTAQVEPEVLPNPIKTTEAVVAWYAHNAVMPYEATATLVLSSTTYNRRLAPNGHTHALVEREGIPISPGWVKMMSKRTGRSIEVCNEFDRAAGARGLCGIEYPWTWVTIGPPSVTEGAVKVLVDEHTISFGPNNQIALDGFIRTLVLERGPSGWYARRPDR